MELHLADKQSQNTPNTIRSFLLRSLLLLNTKMEQADIESGGQQGVIY